MGVNYKYVWLMNLSNGPIWTTLLTYTTWGILFSYLCLFWHQIARIARSNFQTMLSNSKEQNSCFMVHLERLNNLSVPKTAFWVLKCLWRNNVYVKMFKIFVQIRWRGQQSDVWARHLNFTPSICSYSMKWVWQKKFSVLSHEINIFYSIQCCSWHSCH